jgi:hypothetical protein
MTDSSPFGDEPNPEPTKQGPGTKRIVQTIGLVLIAAGFVTKFVIGDAPASEEVGLADYAWLLPIFIGAGMFVIMMKRQR